MINSWDLLEFSIQLSSVALRGYFPGHFKTFLNETEGSWLSCLVSSANVGGLSSEC